MTSQVNFNVYNTADTLGVPLVNHGIFEPIGGLDRSYYYPQGLELGADNGLGVIQSGFPAGRSGLPYAVNGVVPLYFDGQKLRDNDLYFIETGESEPQDLPYILPTNHELDSQLNVYPDGTPLGPLTGPSDYEEKQKRVRNLKIYNGIIERANQLRQVVGGEDQADELLRRAERFLIETAPDLITVVQSGRPIQGFAPVRPVQGHINVGRRNVGRQVQNVAANVAQIEEKAIKERLKEMNALTKTGALRRELRDTSAELEQKGKEILKRVVKAQRGLIMSVPADNEAYLLSLETHVAQLRQAVRDALVAGGLMPSLPSLSSSSSSSSPISPITPTGGSVSGSETSESSSSSSSRRSSGGPETLKPSTTGQVIRGTLENMILQKMDEVKTDIDPEYKSRVTADKLFRAYKSIEDVFMKSKTVYAYGLKRAGIETDKDVSMADLKQMVFDNEEAQIAIAKLLDYFRQKGMPYVE
jgi:hypothetical protein